MEVEIVSVLTAVAILELTKQKVTTERLQLLWNSLPGSKRYHRAGVSSRPSDKLDKSVIVKSGRMTRPRSTSY